MPSSFFESLVDGIVTRRPTVGLAVGVVRNGSPGFFRGQGVSDLESQSPITQDTVFRVASITKTFTAVAVLQLWEQGRIDLDAPATRYLRSYTLSPAQRDWAPPTPRHLLTHTAGIGELAHVTGLVTPDFGESVPTGQRIPRPAELYGGALRIHAEPGTRFVYNNHGPTTLGQIVEDLTGEPLDRYFQEHIFDPIGMTSSSATRTAHIRTRLATGYEIGARGVKEVAEHDMITTGAASVFSTPRDMGRYMAALLGGGSNEQGSILKPATVEMMFQPHYQPDPRIPGMGLGFFRSRVEDRILVGHQGTHPGFHSQIHLSPDDGAGVMLFTNGAARADFWLPSESARLLIGLTGDIARTSSIAPHHPEVWEDIRGWYRLDARFSDIRLRGFIGAGLEVYIRGGQPCLRFLTPVPALARGFTLIPDDPVDPYSFRIEPLGSELEPMRVVFSRDAGHRTVRAHFDIMPLTLEKQPQYANPRRLAGLALGAIGATVASRRALRPY